MDLILQSWDFDVTGNVRLASLMGPHMFPFMTAKPNLLYLVRHPKDKEKKKNLQHQLGKSSLLPERVTEQRVTNVASHFAILAVSDYGDTDYPHPSFLLTAATLKVMC